MQNSFVQRSSFASRVHTMLWVRTVASFFCSRLLCRRGLGDKEQRGDLGRKSREPTYGLRDDASGILAIQTSVSLIIELAAVSSD